MFTLAPPAQGRSSSARSIPSPGRPGITPGFMYASTSSGAHGRYLPHPNSSIPDDLDDAFDPSPVPSPHRKSGSRVRPSPAKMGAAYLVRSRTPISVPPHPLRPDPHAGGMSSSFPAVLRVPGSLTTISEDARARQLNAASSGGALRAVSAQHLRTHRRSSGATGSDFPPPSGWAAAQASRRVGGPSPYGGRRPSESAGDQSDHLPHRSKGSLLNR